MSATLLKHDSIWAFLGQLAAEVDTRQYLIVDHWDADPFAVGIAAINEPARLVYVSTYQQEPGRYFVECETPMEKKDYRVAARVEAVTFESVLEMIRHHLLIDTRTAP